MAEERQNAQSASADEMIDGAAGIVSPEKINEIRKKIKGERPEEAGRTPEPKGDEGKGEPKPDAQKKPEPTAKKGEPVVVNTPFGKKVFGDEPEKGEVKLSSFEDVQAYAKDFYDLEISDVNDFQTILKDYKESKAKAVEADKYKTTATNFETTLKNLPEEVGLLVNAAVNGADYKELLQEMAKSHDLSYDKKFEDYVELDMVNRFNDKSFSQEEYSELKPEDRAVFKELAKAKYDAARTNYLSTKQNTERSTQYIRQAMGNSVESSIAQLRKDYPEMDDDQINRVREIMVSGLRDSLYTEEGTYRPDAAKKVALQEFGSDAIESQAKTIGEIVARLRNTSESTAHENLLKKSDKPEDVGRQAQDRSNKIAEEVKRQTSFLRKR